MPSAFLSDLEMENKIFEDFWKNRNETRNFSQRHEVELIKEERRKMIEEEIRVKVMMSTENQHMLGIEQQNLTRHHL